MRTRFVGYAWVAVLIGASAVAGQDPLSGVPDPLLPQSYQAVGAAGTSVVRSGAPELTAGSVEDFFDAAFHLQRQERALVGATVSVVYRGEVLFKKGYGFADLERRAPVDADETLFRIGSISKPFVWTALMQLEERGLVDLESPVERYIDFTIPQTYEAPIRLRHLMSHTPGFEEGVAGFIARDAESVLPLGEALAATVPGRVSPPGEYASYSNYGSALAGYVLERVAGESWDDFVQDRILDPLGMSNTNVRTRLSEQHRSNHARGYAVLGGALVATPWAYMHLEPAGAISSTASDMARFMLMHLNEGELDGVRLLQSETALRMRDPLFAPHDELPPILHGFYRSDRNGQLIFGHGGNVNQFHSNMALLPESELGIFVSYNSDPGAVTRGSVVNGFLDHFFPTDYLPAAPPPVDVDLEEYQGEYVPLRSNFTSFEKMRTLAMGSAMVLGGDGGLNLGTVLPLVPVGGDRFVARHGGPRVVFERNAAGEVTHMIAGGPLGTMRKVRGLARPSIQKLLADGAVWLAVLAVFGWTIGLVHRVPAEDRLPATHRFVAVLQAGVFVGLVLLLQTVLVRSVFGVELSHRAVVWGLNANIGLGAMVVCFAVDQWWRGVGTGLRRVAYSLVATGVVVQAWFLWSFNLLGGL